LFLLLTAINPLFNTRGQQILFYVFGRPYTLEALLYGADVAGIFVVMLIWFGCYNKVLTGDKFTSLFGNVIPAISLLLVMVFRMVPGLLRKTRQIADARRSVGKGGTDRKEKLQEGMTVLSALISWALEGSIVTGDSMRARGYGAARRTSFRIYRMTTQDWLLLMVLSVLGAGVIAAAATGAVAAVFTPRLYITPITGRYVPGFGAYCAYLLIPTALHIKEALQWSISRSKI
jgi:energy-coupling factor transport system permease protein